MISTRSRVLRAPRTTVWEVVGDPWHLPRWWPRTQRVEGVTGSGWTTVLGTDHGRSIRADWTLDASEPPARRRWHQDLAGTPFERLFDSNATEVTLEEVPEGTRVTLTIEQRVRGWARMAPFLVRRAARTLSDEALDGLTAIVESDA